MMNFGWNFGQSQSIFQQLFLPSYSAQHYPVPNGDLCNIHLDPSSVMEPGVKVFFLFSKEGVLPL